MFFAGTALRFPTAAANLLSGAEKALLRSRGTSEGTLRSALARSRMARPKGFEPLTPKFVVAIFEYPDISPWFLLLRLNLELLVYYYLGVPPYIC